MGWKWIEMEEEIEYSEKYTYYVGDIPVEVNIFRTKTDYTNNYHISIPYLAEGTKIMLNTIKSELISKTKIEASQLLEQKLSPDVKKKFEDAATELLGKYFTDLTQEKRKILTSYLLNSIFGLGELEILMGDEQIEDIVINGPNSPIWVYHKRYGWCKTNLWIKKNEYIYDYSSSIGRKVGRQINILNPIMNANLTSGDRVNATLFPISSFGNTISIRKFSKNPWTMPLFLNEKTLSYELASLIWLCVQNEVSLLVAGGSASGKTSMLNAICSLIPPNQRIISIEDVRELSLPDFLHWVPLVTREPNPEGKGGVEMIDLLVNSLRMRPDRLIVGEVRRQREAEVLFEAMHTGHSVYATIHADNSEECITRLTTPPINLPKSVIPSLGGIVVQFRNRRTGLRRTIEFSEIADDGSSKIIYKWDPREDRLNKIGEMSRLFEQLSLYTGMTKKEMDENLSQKEMILRWMVEKRYFDVNIVGKIAADYYIMEDKVLEAAEKGKDWEL
jgi:flagellar protein FlaI